MHLVNSTIDWLKRIFVLLVFMSIYSFAAAQENSPYSRFGVGDVVPSQNIVSRGMGGISAGYTNPSSTDTKYVTPAFLFQSINLTNPASIGGLNNTVLDIGGEVDIRTLRSTSSPEKYRATNTLISYLQLGFPVTPKKWKKTGNSWGVVLGLRPVNRINYKIEKSERLSGIDSINTLYEGSGGISQINIGTAVHIKNFSFGINTGYAFGTKDYSTKIEFVNDTVLYYKSNSQAKSKFGGLFLNLGTQYQVKMKKGILTLGAYGTLQQKLSATRNYIDETFGYDGNGGIISIDTVNYKNDEDGTVKLPATYGLGFTYANDHWLIGADFEGSNWSAYRYYGQKDEVENSWVIRAGAQYYPAKENTQTSKYWSFVKYRAGFYYGPDYIKLNANRPNYAFTAGASLPLTSIQRIRGDYGFVLLHAGFEFGSRGNRQSFSVRENYTRISIGISMNARWFQKRSYD